MLSAVTGYFFNPYMNTEETSESSHDSGFSESVGPVGNAAINAGFDIPDELVAQLGTRQVKRSRYLGKRYSYVQKRLQLRNDGSCISEVQSETYRRRSDRTSVRVIHKVLSSGKVVGRRKYRRLENKDDQAASVGRAQSCFTREIVNHQHLSHPRIVPVIKSEERNHGDSAECHIWQPYGGLDLNKADGATPDGMNIHQWMHYLLQAFEGVEYMHQQGFVHRDLKPGNIVVDDEGYSRLIDLGFSEQLDFSFPLHNRSGTSYYRAPEVWRREEQNEASDVYAAGMTVVRALEVCGLMKPQPKERLEKACPVQWNLTKKGIDAGIEYIIPVLQQMTADDPAARPSISKAREMLSDEWGPILID
ncbi:protein kinase [Sansalvadorimonas sp. 2012CJ34-2]|uniref:Protein kinase n=1 Tax=Parendozoicomonas callyspongiae TaxID=2942213 RepID=A0ABT0PED2_9GAMM|nr:protein kinase [Sansalvadorimonas sp. 2012CJ34-2]MCL6269727.1 protein kinase [Sansalvadorimonas sp. 2012CJ34-2]